MVVLQKRIFFLFSLFIIIVFGLFFSFYPEVHALDAWNEENEELQVQQIQNRELMDDLLMVHELNKEIYDFLPVSFNHFLHGGYLNMPSARMGESGTLSLGYTSVPPYQNWNARVQLTHFFEISGNYRIFKGVADAILTPMGFGDFSDKGINVKLSLVKPEDSGYEMPGFAVGMEDFHGTKGFYSRYLVMTQVLLDWDMELSLGYGSERLSGFFGGVHWQPFRKAESEWVKGLSFTVEYDATDYKDPTKEKHPNGRNQDSAINYGVKYRLWDAFDFSLGYVRGNEVAASGSAFYNFGKTEGFVPKLFDSQPYSFPVNYEKVGIVRPEDLFVLELTYPFSAQGFTILKAFYYVEKNKTKLKLKITNNKYLDVKELKKRLDCLLIALTPSNIDTIIVTMEAKGFPIHQYEYRQAYIEAYRNHEIGDYLFQLLSPMTELTFSEKKIARALYKKEREKWSFSLAPRIRTLFGSAKGKFKYSVGLSAGFDGYIWKDVFYSLRFGQSFFSNLDDINDMDMLNPSQIINVRTDSISYLKKKSVIIDKLFLQKIWTIGKGFYWRLAGGYFEPQYGGVAAETCYYPVGSPFAFGAEIATLKKREKTGLSFKDEIRKLEKFKETYQKYRGLQYFFNCYYDFKQESILFKVKAGKFLAKDVGVRFEVSRYFSSGLNLYFWYTHTNAGDIVNRERYQDKGIGFSMPLEIFLMNSSKLKWGYSIPVWLRDIGAVSDTGNQIFDLIHEQRN